MSIRPILFAALLALGCPGAVLARQAASETGGVSISRDTLDGYTGRYLTPDGLTLSIWREGDTLKLQPAGGQAIALVADSETTFHTDGASPARVEFGFDATDHVSHLLLIQGGTSVKALHQ